MPLGLGGAGGSKTLLGALLFPLTLPVPVGQLVGLGMNFLWAAGAGYLSPG